MKKEDDARLRGEGILKSTNAILCCFSTQIYQAARSYRAFHDNIDIKDKNINVFKNYDAVERQPACRDLLRPSHNASYSQI